MLQKLMPAGGPEINPFSRLKIAVDICRQSAKFGASVMKCETTNTVLTLVLAVLVLAGVLFALQTHHSARANFAPFRPRPLPAKPT